MTKEQEIALLRECAQKLGESSYCGPWLRQIIPEVETMIRQDYLPAVSMEQTAIECGEKLREATLKAEKLITDAERKAERILSEADERRSGMLSYARHSLQRALATVS